jgi:hypothetical protein
MASSSGSGSGASSVPSGSVVASGSDATGSFIIVDESSFFEPMRFRKISFADASTSVAASSGSTTSAAASSGSTSATALPSDHASSGDADDLAAAAAST